MTKKGSAKKKKETRLQAALRKSKENRTLAALIQNDFDFGIAEMQDFEILRSLSSPNSLFYQKLCELLEDREKALEYISTNILLDTVILLKKQAETAKGPSLSAVEKIVRLIFSVLNIQISEEKQEESQEEKGGIMVVTEFPNPEKWEEIAKKQQIRLVQRASGEGEK